VQPALISWIDLLSGRTRHISARQIDEAGTPVAWPGAAAGSFGEPPADGGHDRHF